jgi:hypothetical protein
VELQPMLGLELLNLVPSQGFGKPFASSLDVACVVNCDDEANSGTLCRNRGVAK